MKRLLRHYMLVMSRWVELLLKTHSVDFTRSCAKLHSHNPNKSNGIADSVTESMTKVSADSTKRNVGFGRIAGIICGVVPSSASKQAHPFMQVEDRFVGLLKNVANDLSTAVSRDTTRFIAKAIVFKGSLQKAVSNLQSRFTVHVQSVKSAIGKGISRTVDSFRATISVLTAAICRNGIVNGITMEIAKARDGKANLKHGHTKTESYTTAKARDGKTNIKLSINQTNYTISGTLMANIIKDVVSQVFTKTSIVAKTTVGCAVLLGGLVYDRARIIATIPQSPEKCTKAKFADNTRAISKAVIGLAKKATGAFLTDTAVFGNARSAVLGVITAVSSCFSCTQSKLSLGVVGSIKTNVAIVSSHFMAEFLTAIRGVTKGKAIYGITFISLLQKVQGSRGNAATKGSVPAYAILQNIQVDSTNATVKGLTSAYATMHTWQLPIQRNDTLYIYQVLNTAQSGDEVIITNTITE